jgi:hypothetical protein
VSTFLGANQERVSHFANALNGTNFVVPNFISLSNLTTITTTATTGGVSANTGFRTESKQGTNSLFGSADFNYKRFLYLSVTGRQDWFSVLNPGNNSIFYPSIGTSVILSDILKMPQKVNLLKIRANWAQVGSATIGAGTVNNTYSMSTSNAYGVPSEDVSITLQNPNLRPLTVTTSEGGFETRMFDSRLGLDVTYYSKVTTNDIVSVNISGASVFTGGNVNIGKTTNKGLEVMLTGAPFRSRTGFSWNANLNYAYNKSRIVELAPTVAELSLGNGIQGARIVNRPGLPYATVMVIQPKVTPKGESIYNSISHFPEGEEIAYGVANPPHTLGFSNNFRYGNFSLDILFDGKFGAVAYSNLMFYATRFGLTPATLPGRDDGLQLTGVDQTGAPFNYLWTPANLQAYYNQLGRGYSALYTYHTDFVKLRRVVLNYNIPINKTKLTWIQSASVALVGTNLAILFRDKSLKDAGLDPEFEESTSNAQGTGGVQEPKTRNIGINLMLKF